MQLMRPRPLRILISSPSDVTLSLLSTILEGFYLITSSSLPTAEKDLGDAGRRKEVIDFILLDYQSDTGISDILTLCSTQPSLGMAKVIQLFTPTAETQSRPLWGRPSVDVGTETTYVDPLEKVVRMNKSGTVFAFWACNADALPGHHGKLGCCICLLLSRIYQRMLSGKLISAKP